MPHLRRRPTDPILGSSLVPGSGQERIHQAEDYWVRRGWLTEELRAKRDEVLAVPGRRGLTPRHKKPLQHGTVHGYKHRGCRCGDCRDALRAYQRERASRKVA